MQAQAQVVHLVHRGQTCHWGALKFWTLVGALAAPHIHQLEKPPQNIFFIVYVFSKWHEAHQQLKTGKKKENQMETRKKQ